VIAAVMQPYFFPYLGYFQLMQAVDLFVFYDDAQYMKGGWVNRNRILVDGEPAWLTLPVRRASLSLPINQRHYLLDGEGIGQIKQRLRASYAKAPAYDEICPLICNLLDYADSNVPAFNANLLTTLARKLGITCAFEMSSAIDKGAGLRGEAKVIDLCQRVGASHYVNAIGGMGLYDVDHFDAIGLRLSFLRTAAPPLQLDAGPQHLSIVHLLMINGFDATLSLLDEYEVMDPHDMVWTRRT
jgi:hypothetical protein